MSNGTQVNEGWMIRRGDAQYGPYPAEAIRAWVLQGKIAQDVLLSDGTRWIALTEFLVLPPETDPVYSHDATREAGSTPTPQSSPLPASGQHGDMTAPAGPIEDPEDETPARDRIVVIGRSRSGKTVFLATLYQMLWRRTGGLTAKALTGSVHKELTAAVDALRHGEWPPATIGSTQMELEIEHNGKKRLLVTLDFQGEIFAKAFVHDQQEDETVKPLLKTIDRAAAVLLIVDPSVVAGQDHAAAVEDDFGLVQAVERIYNWPGGREVPIVCVLTKADQHQHLLDKHGGTVGFVRHHFPALVRVMKQIPIFQVSAVQCTRGANGKVLPKRDSVQLNIDKPLLYCLNKIDHCEELERRQRHDEELQMEMRRIQREQERKDRAQMRWLIAGISAVVLAGAVIVGLIIYYKF